MPDTAPDTAADSAAAPADFSAPNTAALDFLEHRASSAWNTLKPPVPDRAALSELLEIAARVPDHGMLVPWRFLVLQGDALTRLSHLVLERGTALNIPDQKRRKVATMFARAPLIVAVVFAPIPSDKAPEWEQRLTTGAVCLELLNAAEAAGWGANWLTSWIAPDRVFVEQGLGLAPHESISGFIHLGTATAATPARARPDVAALTSWVSV